MAVQVATAVMMAFRDTETGPQPATMPSQWEMQRERKGGLILEKSTLNWDVPVRNVKLLNFKLEVTNILETRAYEIRDEECVLVKKNWLGLVGPLLMETFTEEEKVKCKAKKGLLSVLKQ